MTQEKKEKKTFFCEASLHQATVYDSVDIFFMVFCLIKTYHLLFLSEPGCPGVQVFLSASVSQSQTFPLSEVTNQMENSFFFFYGCPLN